MKNSTTYIILSLLVGLVLGVGTTYAFTKNNSVATSMSTMDHSSMKMEAGTDPMAAVLKDKTGDDFDKNFLSLMIQHHEGALEMAVDAKQNAKHSEIKALAVDIISAQNREIEQMKNWQKEWGY